MFILMGKQHEVWRISTMHHEVWPKNDIYVQLCSSVTYTCDYATIAIHCFRARTGNGNSRLMYHTLSTAYRGRAEFMAMVQLAFLWSRTGFLIVSKRRI